MYIYMCNDNDDFNDNDNDIMIGKLATKRL